MFPAIMEPEHVRVHKSHHWFSLEPHPPNPTSFRNVLILTTEGSEFESRCGHKFPLQRPDLLWGPPSLLSNGYWRPFPPDKAAGPWSRPLTN
jgi:hypothetical protein